MNSYISQFPFQVRKENTKNIMERYPDKIPVVCILADDLVKEKSFYKFLVDKTITLSTLVVTMKKKIKLTHHQSIFTLSETNVLLIQQSSIDVLYNMFGNEDGFLYIHVRKENCFGFN